MAYTVSISYTQGAHMRSRALADAIDGEIATTAANLAGPQASDDALRIAERRVMSHMLSEIIEALPLSPAAIEGLVRRVLDDATANVLVRGG